MQQISLEEAALQFPLLINEAIKGKEVIITQGDLPVVKIVPFAKPKAKPQFGSAKGLIKMSQDFDAPLEHCKEYMP